MKNEMKIDRQKLAAALKKVGIFVGKNGVSDYAPRVHFVNKDCRAMIFATDLNSAGRVYFDTEEPEEFEFCVEYDTISNVLHWKGTEITASFISDVNDNDSIKFYDGRTKAILAARPNDSLAEMEKNTVVPEGNECFEISGKDLKMGINYSKYAREQKESQNEYTMCVHFVIQGSSIDIHATNRKRVAGWKNLATAELEGMESGSQEYLLSPKSVQSVDLFNDEDMVRMYDTGSQVIMATNECEVYASKVNVKFPDINIFFNCDVIGSYTVETSEVLESLSILNYGKAESIMFNFGDGKATVEIKEKDFNMSDEFSCSKVSGDDVSVSFNPQYFQEIFNNVKCKEVAIEFKRMKNGVVILSYKTEGGAYGMLAPHTTA